MSLHQAAFHNKKKDHQASTGDDVLADDFQRNCIGRKWEEYDNMNLKLQELLDLLRTDNAFIEKVSNSTGIDISELRAIETVEMERLFAVMDADHSGTLDFQEFIRLVLKLQRRKKLRDRLSRKDDEQQQGSGSLKDRFLRIVRSKLFFLGLVAFSMFAFGVFMCVQDGTMDVTTAVYVMGQVVTTVGYGDITPKSKMSKVCVATYCLASLVLIAYVINEFVSATMAKQQTQTVESADKSSRCRCLPMEEATRHVTLNSLYVLSLLLFGTIYYSIDEACSCGYGSSRGRVAGCIDGKDGGAYNYDLCVETGGVVKSVVDCFYMSALTMTSVGFGDVTPTSWRGRCVAFVWMTFGVVITGNWVSAMTTFLFERKKAEESISKETLLDWLDIDHDGKLNRAEHHLYWLVLQGVVHEETIESLNQIFDRLAGSENQVSFSQILAESGAEATEEAVDMGPVLLPFPEPLPAWEDQKPDERTPPVLHADFVMSKKGILAARRAQKDKTRNVVVLEVDLVSAEPEVPRRPPPCMECGLGFDLTGQPVAMSKGTSSTRHATGQCEPCPLAHGELGCPDQELCFKCHYIHL
eukprot:TRINITY_DN27522_c0_g1_i1.p1 TRINITY_DN27522_c0_g1~~TRINITY_DN27522_c0_g1_i1.p1  ORF type:complete len:583 (+),score=112.13 TRINITY_DN27522_c0_g1_i1:51-1799(+)